MPVPILIATPQRAFGELLRESLAQQPDYQPAVASSAAETRTLAMAERFALAILDIDLDRQNFTTLFTDIVASSRGIRIILIPSEPAPPGIENINPHATFRRPFYLPDLLRTVGELLAAQPIEPAEEFPSSDAYPDWLQEPKSLRQALRAVLPETQALAGLVGIAGLLDGSGKLLANAGDLPDAAASEIVRILFRYWNADEKTDLMRFVQIADQGNDYLIYATHLIGSLVLVGVYSTSMPLSKIRPETRAAALRMASAPPDAEMPQPAPRHPQPEPTGTQERTTVATEPLTQPAKNATQNASRASIFSYLPDASMEEEEEEVERIDLSALLGSIPEPDPPASAPAGNEEITEIMEEPISLDQKNQWQLVDFPFEPAPLDVPRSAQNRPTQSLVFPGGFPPEPAPRKELASEPEVDPLEDTRPHVVAALTNLGQLEPVSPALSLLNYTCVLVPRFPQHHLTGDLADQLSQWVQHLCLAFGWRLEGISIRPDYLQWSVQVAPSISPGNLVRIVRQRTSLNIFQKYPEFASQNPSGDFWATGYLIVSGAQPPSAQLLRAYINQTRKRQGLAH